MQFPEGYLWDFPGFYSLAVPYGKTNDFFFSGHIGCCMLNYFEFKANKHNKMAYFSLFSLFNQVILMILVRGHYSIDLITGIICGHYFWMFAERYSYLIDEKLFRIPYNKRYPYFNNICNKCGQTLDKC